MAYQKRHTPTEWPSCIPFWDAFDATVASADDFEAFRMNAQNIDRTALKTVAQGRDTASEPLTASDFQSVLVEGAQWRAKSEPDGEKAACVRCLAAGIQREFQPVRISFVRKDGEKGFGGNYRTAKTDEVEKLPESVRKYIDDLTAYVFAQAGETMPAGLNTRAIPMCPSCRAYELDAKDASGNRVMKPSYYVTSTDIVKVLLGRDAIITSAITRREGRQAFDGIFGTRRDGQRSVDNRGSRDSRDRDSQRPKREQVDWNGVRLYPVGQADVLDRLVNDGKLEPTLDSLLSWSPKALETEGVQNPAKVLEFAQMAKDRQERNANLEAVAGEASVELGVHVANHERQRQESRSRRDGNRRERREKRDRSNRYPELHGGGR